MALAQGTRLGPYEILSLAGGGRKDDHFLGRRPHHYFRIADNSEVIADYSFATLSSTSPTPFPVNIGVKHDADSDYKLGRRLTVDLTD